MNNRELMLKRITEIRDEVIFNYESNNLPEYFLKENIEIERNSNGALSKIVFQVSSPYIYLDFDGDYKGRIVALGYPPELEVAPIPLELWWRIEPYLEETFEY